MKNKSAFESNLYSVVGVLLLLVLLVAVNFIASAMKQQVDLTKGKAYTLSAGTRHILQRIDAPIKVRFYYSSSLDVPPQLSVLKSIASEVQDMLAEFRQAAKGKLVIEQMDPKPDSDAEDAAELDGMEGKPLPEGKFYLGLQVSRADTSTTIAFFAPNRERLLEYDVAKAISKVLNPQRPVIGIMSGLPVFGQAANPMMMQMGQRGEDPWALVSDLKNDYDVREVEMTADKIDDDIKTLLVIHPKEISDQTQYAIDQFLMRGGKLAAFLDTISLQDKSGQNPMMGGSLPGGGSSLDKLLKAWGLALEPGKVVADLDYMNRKVRLSSGDNPCWLLISHDSMSQDNVITSDLDELWVPFTGAFTGKPVSELQESVLLKSSKNSELVESMLASLSGENTIKDFKKQDQEYALAVQLTGKFKTAFPDGKPSEEKADETNKVAAAAPSLKESKDTTSVVLVADTDMFSDQFAIQVVRTPIGNFPQVINGNLAFAENIVDNLAGDTDLVTVRSRATLNHPFTRIRAMEAKADEALAGVEREYGEKVQEIQQRLSELQATKDPTQQRSIISPEQQAEIEKGKKALAQLALEHRQKIKELARDKEALKNKIKWTDILAMPFAVAVFGLGMAVVKRQRTAAK